MLIILLRTAIITFVIGSVSELNLNSFSLRGLLSPI